MEQIELEETRMIMQVAAEMLDVFFNGDEKEEVVKRKTGVVLLTFPFTEEEYADIQVNYISNGADRKEIASLLKSLIVRLEKTQGE